MNRFTPVLALLGALTVPTGSSAAQVQSGRAVSTSRQTLEGVYQRFLDGIRRRDTTSYRELLTPDYVYVGGDSGMFVRGRSARLKRDAASKDRWDIFEMERCDLAIQQATAVGPCWYHAVGVSEGERGDWHGVSLVTFVRAKSGQWQIAATRPSVLPSKPQR